MKQLTLTDVAIDYHNKEYGAPKDWQPIELTERQHANNIHAAFKAGAEWQKEQSKELLLDLQMSYRLLKSIKGDSFDEWPEATKIRETLLKAQL